MFWLRFYKFFYKNDFVLVNDEKYCFGNDFCSCYKELSDDLVFGLFIIYKKFFVLLLIRERKEIEIC